MYNNGSFVVLNPLDIKLLVRCLSHYIEQFNYFSSFCDCDFDYDFSYMSLTLSEMLDFFTSVYEENLNCQGGDYYLHILKIFGIDLD